MRPEKTRPELQQAALKVCALMCESGLGDLQFHAEEQGILYTLQVSTILISRVLSSPERRGQVLLVGGTQQPSTPALPCSPDTTTRG